VVHDKSKAGWKNKDRGGTWVKEKSICKGRKKICLGPGTASKGGRGEIHESRKLGNLDEDREETNERWPVRGRGHEFPR